MNLPVPVLRIFFFLGLVFSLLIPHAGYARDLPDFADLAERQGLAVVNISTTQAGRQGRSIPSLEEDDPMFDFFRRLYHLYVEYYL